MTGQILYFPALWETFRTKVLGRKFVRDVGILTIANFVGAVLNFVQAILVARWLGPELYGVAVLVMGYPSLLFTFLDVRSGEASVKYLGEVSTRHERDQGLALCQLAYVVDMGIAALTFLVVAATAWWAAEHVVRTSGVVGLMIIYTAAFIPGSLAGTSCAVLTIEGRFSTLAWMESANSLLKTILILSFILTGWGVSGVIWGNAIGIALSGIGPTILAFPSIKGVWGRTRLFRKSEDPHGYSGKFQRFLLTNWLISSANMIGTQLDALLLGYLRGPTEVGYYKVAKSLAATSVIIINSLRRVVYPRLIRYYAAKQVDAMRTLIVNSLYLGIILAFAFLAFIPVSMYVVPLFLGSAFNQSIFALQILLIGHAVWISQFWSRPLMLTVDIKLLARTMVLFNTVLLLGWVVVARYGFIWVAGWWSICVVVVHSLTSLWSFMLLKSSENMPLETNEDNTIQH